MTTGITVEIINKKGLHARAAAKFVKTVTSSGVDVQVTKIGAEDAQPVSGASILGLMMLGADAGTKLLLSAEGPGAAEAIKALEELILNRFGEPE